MPLPIPNPNEEQNTFVSRCVSYAVNEGMPQEQAVAACNIQWRKAKESSIDFKQKSKIELLNDLRKMIEKNGYSVNDDKLLEIFNMVNKKEMSKKVSFKLESTFETSLTKDQALQRTFEIKIFPERRAYFEQYKETIDFNAKLFKEMITNFKNENLFKPFGDEQHNLGEKYFNIINLDHKKNKGLFAHIRLTSRGYDAIKDEDFSYISPEWGPRTDIDGRKYKNVLWATTLTNIPAFEGELPTLQDQIKLSKFTTGGKTMKFNIEDIRKKLDILDSSIGLQENGEPQPIDPAAFQEALLLLKEAVAQIEALAGAQEEVEEITTKFEEQSSALEQAQKLAKKFTKQTMTLEQVQKIATQFSEKVTELEKRIGKKEKDIFFEDAVRLGKIEANEVDDWQELYDSNTEFVTKILDKKPEKKNGQLSTSLTKDNDGLSDEDIKLAEKEGIDLKNPKIKKEFIELMKEKEE